MELRDGSTSVLVSRVLEAPRRVVKTWRPKPIQ
jgi:hypothetical protein